MVIGFAYENVFLSLTHFVLTLALEADTQCCIRLATPDAPAGRCSVPVQCECSVHACTLCVY